MQSRKTKRRENEWENIMLMKNRIENAIEKDDEEEDEAPKQHKI